MAYIIRNRNDNPLVFDTLDSAIAANPGAHPLFHSTGWINLLSTLLQRAKERGDGLLIDAYEGNKSAANFAKRDFKALMAEIGAEGMTPYNCRHTFSTLAVKAGVRPELLQKIMGHADYATTVGVYTHLDKEDILAVAQGITVTSKLQASQKPQE